MKICSRGENCLHGDPEQPRENFSRRTSSKDGLSYLCKICERDVARKSYQRRKKRERQQQWYQENREKVLERSKRDYEKNREKRLAQAAEYRKRNPEVARKADARRRAKLKSVYSEPYTREEIMERDKYTCQICGLRITDLSNLHIDHIIPIDQGGPDTPENVRVACKRCNLTRPKDGRDILIEEDVRIAKVNRS